MGIVECPNSVVATAEICYRLPSWFVWRFPLDKVHPPTIIRLAVIQDPIKTPFNGDRIIVPVRADHFSSLIGEDLGFCLFLAWDALATTVTNETDVERAKNFHITWQRQCDSVATCLGNLERSFPSWCQLGHGSAGIEVRSVKHDKVTDLVSRGVLAAPVCVILIAVVGLT